MKTATKAVAVVTLTLLLTGWLYLAHHYYSKANEYAETFWKGDIHEKYMVVFVEAFLLLSLVMATITTIAIVAVTLHG